MFRHDKSGRVQTIAPCTNKTIACTARLVAWATGGTAGNEPEQSTSELKTPADGWDHQSHDSMTQIVFKWFQVGSFSIEIVTHGAKPGNKWDKALYCTCFFLFIIRKYFFTFKKKRGGGGGSRHWSVVKSTSWSSWSELRSVTTRWSKSFTMTVAFSVITEKGTVKIFLNAWIHQMLHNSHFVLLYFQRVSPVSWLMRKK